MMEEDAPARKASASIASQYKVLASGLLLTVVSALLALTSLPAASSFSRLSSVLAGSGLPSDRGRGDGASRSREAILSGSPQEVIGTALLVGAREQEFDVAPLVVPRRLQQQLQQAPPKVLSHLGVLGLFAASKRPMPTSQKFETYMQALFERSIAQDPCEAKKFSAPNPFFGFGSKLFLFTSELWLETIVSIVASEHSDLLPVEAAAIEPPTWALCWGNKFMTTVWGNFFDIEGLPVCKDSHKCGKKVSLGKETMKGIYGTVRSKYGSKLGSIEVQVSTHKAVMYQRVLRYRPDISKFVNDAWKTLGIPEGEPYIACHIRHGDKRKEKSPQPTSRYAGIARKVAAARGISWVVLASDDGHALEDFRKAVPLDSNIKVVAYNHSNSGAGMRGAYSESSLSHLLIDLECLRRSAYFIGTGSSNMGTLVFYLRGGAVPGHQNKSMTLDVSFFRLVSR